MPKLCLKCGATVIKPTLQNCLLGACDKESSTVVAYSLCLKIFACRYFPFYSYYYGLSEKNFLVQS